MLGTRGHFVTTIIGLRVTRLRTGFQRDVTHVPLRGVQTGSRAHTVRCPVRNGAPYLGLKQSLSCIQDA